MHYVYSYNDFGIIIVALIVLLCSVGLGNANCEMIHSHVSGVTLGKHCVGKYEIYNDYMTTHNE